MQPRVGATEPAFAPLLAAVQAGRAVSFDHRRGGPGGEVTRRTVEPWGVVSWRGRWYLVGHDRDRNAPRSFRVSRISEPVTPIGRPGAVTVPADVDLMAMVRHNVSPPPVTGTARVWVADGRAQGLRRLGRTLGRRTLDGRVGRRAGARAAQPGRGGALAVRARPGRGGAAPGRARRGGAGQLGGRRGGARRAGAGARMRGTR